MLSVELDKLAIYLVGFFETRMVHSLVSIPFLAVLILVIEMLVERLEEVLVGLEWALLERHDHVHARYVLDLLRQAFKNGFSQLLDRDGAVHGKCNGQGIPLILDYVNFEIDLPFGLGQRQLDIAIDVAGDAAIGRYVCVKFEAQVLDLYLVRQQDVVQLQQL